MNATPEPQRAPATARRPGWFARPVLSALIAATWLLLQQSVAPANLITATVLALGLPRLLDGFLGTGLGLRSAVAALRFTGIVLWDIVVSNLTVARLVLDPRARPQPAWVPVPYTLTDPVAITLLAAVITTTPGTVSCTVDEARRVILVHALDCADPAEMAAQIRARYEAPLAEIFG